MDEIIDGHIKFEGREPIPVDNVLDLLPSEVNTYHEPFIEHSFLLVDAFIEGREIESNGIICYSFDQLLVEMWEMAKNNLGLLLTNYKSRFLHIASLDDIERLSYISSMIDGVNSGTPDVHDFFYLWWSHFRRMSIYGKDAESYVFSHHLVLEKSSYANVVQYFARVSKFLYMRNVQFVHMEDITSVESQEGDFVFCDPIFDKKNDDFQFGTINDLQYFNWLRTLNSNYIFTFPPKIDKNNIELDVPTDIYSRVYLLKQIRNVGFNNRNKYLSKSEYYFVR